MASHAPSPTSAHIQKLTVNQPSLGTSTLLPKRRAAGAFAAEFCLERVADLTRDRRPSNEGSADGRRSHMTHLCETRWRCRDSCYERPLRTAISLDDGVNRDLLGGDFAARSGDCA